MRNRETIEFKGRLVTVKEMTVLELDEHLGSEQSDSPSMLDRLLRKHMLTGDLLSAATGVSVGDMAKVAPSQLAPMVKKFQEVNPDFFEMARFEMDRAQEMAEALGTILDPAQIL